MRIESIGRQYAPELNRVAIEDTDQPKSGDSFGATIKNAISSVNELQVEADQLANRLAAGDAVEVHQAMIAMQKASTALQFTIQVRNKIIEAYQEIMRMQV